ncbi:NAD(P)-dependent dehydrogenase (short-subunit alcohol dehydrogenase family) [Bradyrhizobium macuxiense]|uniref:NAD(P)-dependent dehydrogenase (Short-subunit alcohol dehydrogenase family) n=2 Tax=Bradyrhizobium macuxiense TaxID=1755647 RepID=A0A560KX66_9BRAD|nr:NAD(P)-dependent dehydrogenase (short-subunit alcohol dehydrogenase family) [Bradyrhizobium macuxiense]
MVTVVGRRRALVEDVAREAGGYALSYDMADETQAFQAVNEAAAQMGEIDGLVNTIGGGDYASLEDIDMAYWERSFRNNLVPHYLACRAALPHLRKATNASIVNVAALAAIMPGVASAPYAAAKAGVVQFTKMIAVQLAPTIRANSVSPGAVRTQRMIDGFLANKSEEQIAAFVGRYACNRLAEPDEVASLILFLLSSEASYLTGCNYIADGGRSYR